MFKLIIYLNFFISSFYSYNILLFQTSNINYNRQEWEDLNEYTLIELSEIDVINYSQYHNYTYKRYYYSNEDIEEYDLHPIWTKVFTLSRLIKDIKYDYIVLLDVDIFFMNYTQSIIDKINEWDSNKESLIYMPEDTDEYTNYMTPYNTTSWILNVNTGFQIWKVNSITIDIVTKWKECIISLPECSKWKWNWPFDQGAFNHIIRPQLLPNQLKIIPCDEANGFPIEYDNYIIDQNGDTYDLGNHNCNGRFVSHFWEESKRYNHDKLEKFLKKKYFQQQLNKIRNNHTVIL